MGLKTPKTPALFALLGLAYSLASLAAAPATSRIPPPAKPLPPSMAPGDDGTSPHLRCPPGTKDPRCASQAESFKRAAQASSYLAHYMKTQSLFATRMKDDANVLKTNEAIKNCTTGPSCSSEDQALMMAALIQYNLGKEVKSMILQNNTNEAALKSIPEQRVLRGKNQHRLGTGFSYEDSFKLNPANLGAREEFSLDAKKIQERQMLGEEFKKDFEKFIDVYSSTTDGKERWHYVASPPGAGNGSDGAAVGNTAKNQKHYTWDLDPADGFRPKLNKPRFEYDQKIQMSKNVRQVVTNFKDSLVAPSVINDDKNQPATDPNQAAQNQSKAKPAKNPNEIKITNPKEDLRFTELGLGVPERMQIGKDPIKDVTTDEKVIAENVVGIINRQVAEAERKVASNGKGGKNIPNVQVDIKDFDAYLDRIWPPTGLPKVK